MILRINPNRMELIRLKKRLALARRGHKLLQDKLEEMMRRLLALIKDINKAKQDFQERTGRIIEDLLYCRITSPKEEFEKSIAEVKPDVKIALSMAAIMNVKVPSFKIESIKIEKNYDFFKTSAQLDFVINSSHDYIKSLLDLAGLLKGLEILSFEIERTRRRVNALEYILIPSIEETIKYITQKLNELERGNFVRLMRVKELIEAR
jgi:V/A-type H+-transporting ATPase subunit D